MATHRLSPRGRRLAASRTDSVARPDLNLDSIGQKPPLQQTAPLPPSRTSTSDDVRRCRWASNELAIAYHDEEWGVPMHDDRRLFEFLILEGAQAGLSWDTILKKRANYRVAFDNFDPPRVA